MVKEINGIEIKCEKNIEKEVRKTKLVNIILCSLFILGIILIKLSHFTLDQYFLVGAVGILMVLPFFLMWVKYVFRIRSVSEICSLMNHNKLLSIKVVDSHYNNLYKEFIFYYEKNNGDVEFNSISLLDVKSNTKVSKMQMNLDDFILYVPYSNK